MGEPCTRIREVPEEWHVRVARALRGSVVVCQAEGASGDHLGPASEGLVVQAGVRHQPVQIFPGQYLPPELPVVGHPPLRLVAALGTPGKRRTRGAFAGKRVVSIAAIRENLSNHTEMSVTGRRAGGAGRPRMWGVRSSEVISEISTNSSSRIFFTTLGGSAAAGLYSPGFARSVEVAEEAVGACWWAGPQGCDSEELEATVPSWQRIEDWQE